VQPLWEEGGDDFHWAVEVAEAMARGGVAPRCASSVSGRTTGIAGGATWAAGNSEGEGYDEARAFWAAAHALEAAIHATAGDVAATVKDAAHAGHSSAEVTGLDLGFGEVRICDLGEADRAAAADLERLVSLGTRQVTVDASEAGPLGPLWPDGAPAWYSRPTA
jgi:hypothetical protein